MHLSGKHKTLISLYGLGWSVVSPALALSQRMRQGYWERLLHRNWGRSPHWQDVWIQAASGGEAYLAFELINELAQEKINVLATSGTSQGMEVLGKVQAWCSANKQRGLRFQREYFPFDAPRLMRKALSLTLPKVVVLLETELWPGLLSACAEQDLPVVVVNGRMSAKSLAGYLTMAGFFRATAPRKILAISQADARRFGTLFGQDRVTVMPNMKFDRVDIASEDPAHNPVSALLKTNSSLAVFGSVRRQEETDLVPVIAELRQARPKTSIGLFPRHMHRVNAWSTLLEKAELPFVLRSTISEPVAPGTLILWDAFGELDAAYALCRAAFVGGSLKPLGGQNFLEPLAHGVVPCIGPHWKNFSWVGRDIFNQGLAVQVKDAEELAQRMVKLLERPQAKDTVKERFSGYVSSRQGGTLLAADLIRRVLDEQSDRQE
ncbi:MAG: 3-deoxy-D-manno-octulosonic acid transferase [Desulfovibrio sp.]|nr:MAG: 3-deoxy-D-manno-octulosonic acid transferase [Desulfovibrio sp.]